MAATVATVAATAGANEMATTTPTAAETGAAAASATTAGLTTAFTALVHGSSSSSWSSCPSTESRRSSPLPPTRRHRRQSGGARRARIERAAAGERGIRARMPRCRARDRVRVPGCMDPAVAVQGPRYRSDPVARTLCRSDSSRTPRHSDPSSCPASVCSVRVSGIPRAGRILGCRSAITALHCYYCCYYRVEQQ